MIADKLNSVIRDIPDFPKPGIVFKDITPIFQHADLVQEMVDEIASSWSGKGITAVAGIESRGFLIGPAIAVKMNVPFIPIRKKGKLPAETIAYTYDLEYGAATIEIHKDALNKGDKVLIHDDLLATGGTALAAKHLVEEIGATTVGYSFIIGLNFLNGKSKLEGHKQLTPVQSLIEY